MFNKVRNHFSKSYYFQNEFRGHLFIAILVALLLYLSFVFVTRSTPLTKTIILTIIVLSYLIMTIRYFALNSKYDGFLRKGTINAVAFYVSPVIYCIISFYAYGLFKLNNGSGITLLFVNTSKFIFGAVAVSTMVLQLTFLLTMLGLPRRIRNQISTAFYFFLFVLSYFTCGLCFSILFLLQDGSLTGRLENNMIWDTTYFSFVTLATTGYGDISPITNWSKTLVIIENLLGLVLTAYIISMIFAVRRKK